jgi:hypothetical protein
MLIVEEWTSTLLYTICLHKDCKIVAPQQVMHQKVKTTALIQQPEEIDEREKRKDHKCSLQVQDSSYWVQC